MQERHCIFGDFHYKIIGILICTENVLLDTASG